MYIISHENMGNGCNSKDSSSPVLVLEDDIEVCENFYDKLDYVMKNIPQNWDLVFLGHHPYDVNEITKN